MAGIVLLGSSTISLCSGTLIAPSLVVTAAHCFDTDPLRAVVGFFPDGVTEEDYEGAAYALHPSYAPGRLAYADIALLALRVPVSNVSPLPLASTSPRPRRRGEIVGFGQDDTGMIGAKEVGTVRLTRCPKAFPRAGLTRGQLGTSLCWRPRRHGQDTCHGDSGGPLIVAGSVAGITSGGFPECPGVLSWDTDVAPFVSWINGFL